MSPTTDEGDDQMKCVLRDLARAMASKKWLFGKLLPHNETYNEITVNGRETSTMVRLRQALSRDPVALHTLFDMFASAVCNRSSDNNTGEIMAALRCLSLSAVTDVRSFDALRARVDATTADIPVAELIEHLLKKVDDDDDGGGGGGLNFRSVPFPSCVVAAVGLRLPRNSFTFAMGPRRGDDDGGHGEGLFVCVPVTSATGAYGELARWPTPPEVGAAEDLQVALSTARWINSWGDASLFGGGRYQSVLVCNARRSARDSQLPYEIGPPRYLVVCAEQTRAKTARRLRRKHGDTAAVHVSVRHLRTWNLLVLGAVVLMGGYMAYRYGVSAIWQPTYHWPIGAIGQFATKRSVSKP